MYCLSLIIKILARGAGAHNIVSSFASADWFAGELAAKFLTHLGAVLSDCTATVTQ